MSFGMVMRDHSTKITLFSLAIDRKNRFYWNISHTFNKVWLWFTICEWKKIIWSNTNSPETLFIIRFSVNRELFGLRLGICIVALKAPALSTFSRVHTGEIRTKTQSLGIKQERWDYNMFCAQCVELTGASFCKNDGRRSWNLLDIIWIHLKKKYFLLKIGNMSE